MVRVTEVRVGDSKVSVTKAMVRFALWLGLQRLVLIYLLLLR